MEMFIENLPKATHRESIESSNYIPDISEDEESSSSLEGVTEF